jgi:2-oxoisovalerate dehydrogenase E2 component (dihydrolipoyl transacylase)
VQSDKATVDITSRYDGVIRKLYYKVGDMAPTGKPLLDIELAGTSGSATAGASADAPIAAPPSASAPAGAASATAAARAPPPSGHGDSSEYTRSLATPAVRRIAREHNVDIHNISGTGKDGRVTKEDVILFVEGGGAAAAARAAAAAPGAAAVAPASAAKAGGDRAAASAPVPAPLPPVAPGVIPADTRVPLRGLQKAMVKSMTAAWAVPHFGYSDEYCMDGAMAARAALKAAAAARGIKFSYLPLIIKATSLALTQFPQLNAAMSADGSELVHRGSHNIGVAVDSPRGLIVPNVKAVQQRSLLDIAHELQRLQALAAGSKLGEADLMDGTFT